MSMTLGEPRGFHPFFVKPSRTALVTLTLNRANDFAEDVADDRTEQEKTFGSACQSGQARMDTSKSDATPSVSHKRVIGVGEPVHSTSTTIQSDIGLTHLEIPRTLAERAERQGIASSKEQMTSRRRSRKGERSLDEHTDNMTAQSKRRKVDTAIPSKAHPWFEQLKPPDTRISSVTERDGSIDTTHVAPVDDAVNKDDVTDSRKHSDTPPRILRSSMDKQQNQTSRGGQSVLSSLETKPSVVETLPTNIVVSPESKTTLQLNGKGGFALPELPVKPVASVAPEFSTKPNSRRRKLKHRIVKMRYGQNDKGKRSLLCQKIEDILSEPTKDIPKALIPSVTAASQPKPQPSKTTHPFFLGRIAPKTDVENATDVVENGRTLPVSSRLSKSVYKGYTTPRQMHPRQRLIESTIPCTSAQRYPQAIRPFSLPGSINSPWPYREFTRIESLTERPGSSREQQHGRPMRQYKQRMRKDRKVVVTPEELVTRRLHPMVQSRADNPHHHQRRESLEVPERFVLSGTGLQALVRGQLSHGVWESDAKTFRQEHAKQKLLSHATLPKLYANLANTLSSFDDGESETIAWAQKYAPRCAEDVLQIGKEVDALKNWMQSLTIAAVASGVREGGSLQKQLETVKRIEKRRRRKKRKREAELDGFIVSSEGEAAEMHQLSGDEDALEDEYGKSVIRAGDAVTHPKGKAGKNTNTILLSGPHGCGKSAAVYAVAKELGFDIFEINAGGRRSGKDVMDKVGDMTRNHLVHKREKVKSDSDPSTDSAVPEAEDEQQSKLKSFFTVKPKQTNPQMEKQQVKSSKVAADSAQMKSNQQKQSLILFEDVDVLFEEDRGFWETVLDLAVQSKRPIILTCKDEAVIPIQALSLHAILRFRPAPLSLATDYLLLIAATEGHAVQREAVQDLYHANNHDLRLTLMDLNFWCQMGVGDQRGGLDWFLNRWPQGVDRNEHGHVLRMISKDTYRSGLSFFGSTAHNGTWNSEDRIMHETWNEWQVHSSMISQQAFESSFVKASNDGTGPKARFSSLEAYSRLADHLSSSDVYARVDLPQSRNVGSFERCGATSARNGFLAQDILDPTQPELLENKRHANYVIGYPLLQADILHDPEKLDTRIAIAAHLSIKRQLDDIHASKHVPRKLNHLLTGHILAPSASPLTRKDFSAALDAIADDPSYPLIPSSSSSSSLLHAGTTLTPTSFDRAFSIVVHDLAPYVRAIGAYDLALEARRRQHDGGNGACPGGTGSSKRTTRASRSAVEGGRRAETRRERWFHGSRAVDLERALRTGGKAWPRLPAGDAAGGGSEQGDVQRAMDVGADELAEDY